MKSKLFTIVIFLIVFVSIERFCRSQTAGFRIDKIHSDFVFAPPQVEDPSPDISALLDQRFTFLGSGVQFYAFLGEDQKTVLKVFKHYHNFPIKGSFKTCELPQFLNEWRHKIIQGRENRLRSIFTSCTLAYENFKEESGLIYLHLNSTRSFSKKLTLIDKLGIAYAVDLDTTAFLLQERAEMLTPKLESLLAQGKKEEAKACVDSLYRLITLRGEKGFSNHDLRIDRNIGFIGSRAIEIDTGSFKRKQKKGASMKELKKCKSWIQAHFPELDDST